jgi:hypothetical protein
MKFRPNNVFGAIGPSACLILALLSAGSAGGGNPAQEQAGSPVPSRKIGYFTYLNEEVSAVLMVDVELARMRKDENYIPLSMKLANKGLHALKIGRQSFELLDPADAAYSMPGFKALEAVYKKYSADAKFYARKIFTEGDVQTSFSTFRKLPCSFFPHPAKDSTMHDVLIEEVEIPQGSYIEDLLYFPRPKGSEPGQVLRLRLLDEDREPFIEVGFVIE